MKRIGPKKKKYTVDDVFDFDLPKPIKIVGNGTSIWSQHGESNGTYLIDKVHIEHVVDDLDEWGHLELFGVGTEWDQYTDKQIEKQVFKKFKKIVEDKTGAKVEWIGWSEQGMQPDGGWDFDVTFVEEKNA